MAELDGRNIFLLEVAETNKLELLKWAREEKKCEWDERTINAAAEQGNLEMVKYCVANECPIDVRRVQMLPKTVISRYSNTYAKKSKRLGIGVLPLGRLKMVISTYSNILLSVSMINMTNVRVICGHERPLRLFEVLARNRQSALELWAVRERTRTTTPNVYNTSSTTTVLYHMVGDTNMESYTLHKINTTHTHTRTRTHALVKTQPHTERETPHKT